MKPKEFWIVCRQSDEATTEEDIENWEPPDEYLTEEGEWSKVFGLAQVFPTRVSCHTTIRLLISLARAREEEIDVGAPGYRRIHSDDAARIARHKLKLKARDLFGISARAPERIIADRFGDAGMEYEQMVMLRKI